jgi:hypothetical protein
MGLATGAVGLGFLDPGGVGLDVHAQTRAEVERLLVGEA